MKLSREPAASITPQPVARRPGSTPRMQIAPMVIQRLIYEIERQRILRGGAILARGLDQTRQLALDRPEFCECGVEGAKSERLPNALHPLGQIVDGQRQPAPLAASAPFSLMR